MDADQRTLANPLGMDEACENCALHERRERVVHGYGRVDADFLFVGEAPSAAAEAAGVPFVDDEVGRAVQSILGDLDLSASSPDATAPEVENAYLTYLTRCRHPDRAATEAEVATCEPFLNAEVRAINPEVLVPVGTRALRALAAEHTTKPPESFDRNDHAREIRGRGFALVPMRDPAEWERSDRDAFVETMASIMGRDYRQTKGRRGREERERRREG